MEEQHYAWHIIVLWLIFNKDFIYNCTIFIIVKKYQCEEGSERSDFNLQMFMWNAPNAAPGFIEHKKELHQRIVINFNHFHRQMSLASYMQCMDSQESEAMEWLNKCLEWKVRRALRICGRCIIWFLQTFEGVVKLK